MTATFPGGGGGDVASVNGQTGVVVLDATDVGADPAGAAAAAQAASQPLDSDLTALAALSTTTFGRALLELANAGAGRTALGLGSAALAASGDFDAAGAAAAAQAASQPVDGDLTAIAALTTTSYGRAFLALADAAAARSALALGTAATQATGAFDAAGAAAAAQAASQPLDSDLTAIAALSTTTFGRSLLTQADAAAVRTAIGAAASGGSGGAPTFQGNRVYAAGDLITGPNGDALRRVTAGTSAATFTVAESANWAGLSPRLATLEKKDMWAFGHSYVNGSGGGSWASRLFGRHNMGTYSDRSAPGENCGQMADRVRQVALGEFGSLSGTHVLMSMINDASVAVATPTVVEGYRSTFAQLISTRNLITSTAFVFGSGWTAGVSTTPGSYFDWSFIGDTAYLLMGFTSGAAVNFDVVRSGTGAAAYSSFNTGGYVRAFPGVVKFSGFGEGNHTVRVTYSSGAQATVYMGLTPNPYPPTVLWAQEGPIPNFGADGAAPNVLMTTTYPAAVAAILGDFPTVIPVPPTGWDSSTMVYGDLVHANDRGVKYWADRCEQALRTVDFRQGQNFMFGITAPAIARASSYSTGTINQATVYSNLRTWTSDGSYLYSVSPDLPALSVGMSIVITGGTGWVPGNYQIVGVNLAFGTPDGTRNMYQVVRNPNYLNVNAKPAPVAGTAGGIGTVSA